MPNFTVIESPYAPQSKDTNLAKVELARNIAYVRACLADSFSRGEVPFASHAIYTLPGVLDDTIPEERVKGMAAGLSVLDTLMRHEGFVHAFYLDRGWSNGMRLALSHTKTVKIYQESNVCIEIRKLGSSWAQENDCQYWLDSVGGLRTQIKTKEEK